MSKRNTQAEEVAVAAFTRELNRIRGTDYRAEMVSPGADPPDAWLRSMKQPPIDVEVVTAPIDNRYRDSNGVPANVERRLSALLDGQCPPLYFGIGLSDEGFRRGLTARMLKELAQILLQHAPEAEAQHVEIEGANLYEDHEELADLIDHAVIGNVGSPALLVHVNPATPLPADDGWIRDAAIKKAEQYAPAVSASMTLLIAAEIFIDDTMIDEAVRQVEAYARLPFGEIWIVGGFDSRAPTCLKRAQ